MTSQSPPPSPHSDLHWTKPYQYTPFPFYSFTEGLSVGNFDLSQSDMSVIVLKDITTETSASVERLLEVLSEHIDTLADASHYFVIDPTDTTIMSASITGVS